MRHRCAGRDCQVCESIAEERAHGQYVGRREQDRESDRAADRYERNYWGDSR